MESVTCVENSAPNQRYPIAIYIFLKWGDMSIVGNKSALCHRIARIPSLVSSLQLAVDQTNAYLKNTILCYIPYIYIILQFITIRQYCNRILSDITLYNKIDWEGSTQ